MDRGIFFFFSHQGKSKYNKARRRKQTKQNPLDCSSGLFPQPYPHLTVHCCLLFSPNLTDTFLITIFNMTIKRRRSADCFCTIPKYVTPAFPPSCSSCCHTHQETSLHFRPTWCDRCQEAHCLRGSGAEGWWDWKSDHCDNDKTWILCLHKQNQPGSNSVC